jgi:hypothetical protein
MKRKCISCEPTKQPEDFNKIEDGTCQPRTYYVCAECKIKAFTAKDWAYFFFGIGLISAIVILILANQGNSGGCYDCDRYDRAELYGFSPQPMRPMD